MNIESKIKVAFGLTILIMATLATLPKLVNRQVSAVMTEQRDVARVERLQLTLLEMLLNAETAQRGFVITGNERFLEPYHTAVHEIPSVQRALRSEFSDSDGVLRIIAIEKGTAAKMETVDRVIDVRRKHGLTQATEIVSSGTGKAQMDHLRQLIGKELEISSARRRDLSDKLLTTSSLAATASLIATLTNILFLGGVSVAASRVLRQRDNAERKAMDAASQAERTNERVQRQNDSLSRSAELMHSLELAESTDEAADVIASYLPRLLPSLSGSLYLYNSSRDILERKAGWGAFEGEPEAIEALECWALRRGSRHAYNGEPGELVCKHVHNPNMHRLCLSLVTQGDVIGCLSVTGAGLAHGGDNQRAWIEQIAEQLALALSNVRLRVSLRQQSIVDSLTQLYNRRYMDEVLKREFARAERNGTPVSVLVLDLDYFKRINDTFGHEAGDATLRKVALILRENIRACDVACRMGGKRWSCCCLIAVSRMRRNVASPCAWRLPMAT